jgi:hypothetical protein
MFNEASQKLYTSTIVVSHDPLIPSLSISSALKTTDNTQGDPDDTEQADEGDIQVEYSYD